MVQPQRLDDLIEGPVAAISQVGGRDEVPGTAVCVCVCVCIGVCEYNVLHRCRTFFWRRCVCVCLYVYLQDGGGLGGADTAVGIVGGEAIGEEAGEGRDCEVFS